MVLISGMEMCSSMRNMLELKGSGDRIFYRKITSHLSCYIVLAEVLSCFTVNLSITIINAVMSPFPFT